MHDGVWGLGLRTRKKLTSIPPSFSGSREAAAAGDEPAEMMAAPSQASAPVGGPEAVREATVDTWAAETLCSVAEGGPRFLHCGPGGSTWTEIHTGEAEVRYIGEISAYHQCIRSLLLLFIAIGSADVQGRQHRVADR